MYKISLLQCHKTANTFRPQINTTKKMEKIGISGSKDQKCWMLPEYSFYIQESLRNVGTYLSSSAVRSGIPFDLYQRTVFIYFVMLILFIIDIFFYVTQITTLPLVTFRFFFIHMRRSGVTCRVQAKNPISKCLQEMDGIGLC